MKEKKNITLGTVIATSIGAIFWIVIAFFHRQLFFARPFWTKLQNIFGHYCMSILDNIAKPWPA